MVKNAVITSDVFLFSMTVPQSWHILSAQQYCDALKRNILRDDQRHNLGRITAPIVTVMRHPEPLVEFNPGLVVQADRRQEWMGNNILDLHKMFHERYVQYNRCSVTQIEPHATRLSGVEAASSTISYDHLTEDGGAARVNAEVYSVFHAGSVFFMASGSFSDERQNEVDPFDMLAPGISFI